MEDPGFPWDHNTRPEHEAGVIQKLMPLAHPNPECASIPRRSVLSMLSLEAYMDMHAALTKGSLPKIQKVSPVERAMYKMNDLKQVLLMHGLSAGSKNKQDLLDVMEGLTLATPALHIDGNTSGNQQATNHVQHVQLDINVADLALLGWMKPEKASTVEAALGRPKQLSGLCDLPLAEGLAGPKCQSQGGVPMLNAPLAEQAVAAPGNDVLPTAVFDLSAACAPDARAQLVCIGAGPSASKQTHEQHEQPPPLTPGRQGSTHSAAIPDGDTDRHQMTACPSQAAAAAQHTPSGAPGSHGSLHICEAAQQQVLAMPMRRDDGGTLSAAAATETSRLINRPPLPAKARLPQEPPGTTGTAQTPCTTNTIPKAAEVEAYNASLKRVADDQPDDRALVTQCDATHDARVGPEGCLIGSDSVPWRSKRKAACLEPAATGLLPEQPESPHKRRSDPHFAAPPSRPVSEKRAEDTPRTDPQGAALHAPAVAESGGNTHAPVRSHEMAAVKCSQDLLAPARCEVPARSLCMGSHEQFQHAAEHTDSRNDSAPIAVEEVGAEASNSGHCPTWLAEEVLQLAQKSIAAPLPEVSKPGCLIGRSIAFVLLEDFDAGGDTVMRGIKTGRVLEHISDDHIEELCSRTCTQQHSYHYVRLNRSGLTKQPGVGTKKRGLKVDFKLDLHPSLNQKSLASLLLLNSTALQDAWMLLEPISQPA
ncbi:hypothetical protein COCOBI_03-1180 [Coccomyxa sp. Obi]|nr:hypothetical protein COCOBI_03-1180 [Coccomyxa sp. Obi]